MVSGCCLPISRVCLFSTESIAHSHHVYCPKCGEMCFEVEINSEKRVTFKYCSQMKVPYIEIRSQLQKRFHPFVALIRVNFYDLLQAFAKAYS